MTRRLNIFTKFLALTALVSAASVANAQPAAGDTQGWLDFRGAVGGGGSLVNAVVGPYKAGFSTVSLAAATSATQFDIFCFDFNGIAGDGKVAVMTFAQAVAYAPLVNKFANTAGISGTDLTAAKLNQVAWLTTQFDAGKTNWVNVHHAIWGTMWETGFDGPGSVGLLPSMGNPATVGTAAWWAGQAVTNGGSFNTSNYRVFVALDANGNFDASRQTFIGSVNSEPFIVTPEPSTYLLMASGLLGLGVAARRRRRQTSV